MKVDEKVNYILEEAYKLTGTDYNVYWRDHDEIDGFVEPEDVMKLLEDLVEQYKVLEEMHEDLKKDVEEHYQRIYEEDYVDEYVDNRWMEANRG